MNESTIPEQATPCASLAALGVYLQHISLFEPIHTTVKIAQKTVKHTPTDKLIDALIVMLAGADGLVEINTRLRTDPALQRAFGRSACAEQSVVQETLDACTAANVSELQQALTSIYRQHSRGFCHDYQQSWQILDVDMSGLPCGPKAACATKGYFAKQRNRRGRQLGRVLATHYQEVVVDHVFAGKAQLTGTLQGLVEQAEAVLALDTDKRQRTLIRVDAGGGSLDDVNWLLKRGYAVLAKDYSTARSTRLAASVKEWYPDPKVSGREVGWVSEPATDYVRPVVRVAVRCRNAKGQWRYGVLIGPPDQSAIASTEVTPNERDSALAYVYAYDARGGGIETSFRGDKSGLGLNKRSKKRFEAQQMVTMLGSLAHNIVIWARTWLLSQQPKLRRYGIKRMVRDVLHISGRVRYGCDGKVQEITFNHLAPLVSGLWAAFVTLIALSHVVVRLGET